MLGSNQRRLSRRFYSLLLFSRIVPCAKDIGLWGEKVRGAYEKMGVLSLADADLTAMGRADEDVADNFDGTLAEQAELETRKRQVAETIAAAERCAARATTLMEVLDAHYPSALPPHVHVMFAAARPEARSWGAGVLLVRALIRQRSDNGVGLYAEASSPDNLSLWQEMGARRIGAEIALPADGPSLYPIWREAVSVGR